LGAAVPISDIRSFLEYVTQKNTEIHDDSVDFSDRRDLIPLWEMSKTEPMRFAWDLRRLTNNFEDFRDLYIDLVFATGTTDDLPICTVRTEPDVGTGTTVIESDFDDDVIRAYWMLVDRPRTDQDKLLIDAMESFAHGNSYW